MITCKTVAQVQNPRKRSRKRTIALLALLVAITVMPPARADTVIEWSRDKDGPQKSYRVDGLQLTVSAKENNDGEGPRVDVTAPGGASTTIYGVTPSPSDYPVQLRVTRLDPAHSEADVMFGSFSGGAHCCTAIKVLSLINNTWRVADLGQWNGDGMPAPQDPSGTGKPALVFGDNAFLYAFASYAESAAPPKILRVENGKEIDVSADPVYRPLFRQSMAETKELCTKGGNGGCAAYVASAARLGLDEEAWGFMLRHYDRHSDWDMSFCGPAGNAKCASFPQALDSFLRQNGYRRAATVTPPPVPRADGASQTAMLCGRPVTYALDPTQSSRLFGIWTGAWNSSARLCGGLIVESVDADSAGATRRKRSRG